MKSNRLSVFLAFGRQNAVYEIIVRFHCGKHRRLQRRVITILAAFFSCFGDIGGFFRIFCGICIIEKRGNGFKVIGRIGRRIFRFAVFSV